MNKVFLSNSEREKYLFWSMIMIIGLLVIFILVLFLPFTVSVVEKNLEIFLFVMGLVAAALSGVFNGALFVKAASDPINISIAVLIAGLLFKWLQTPLEKLITGMSRIIPFRLFACLVVILLGLVSSIITAIIAALVLVLVVGSLQLDRKSEVRFVVLACFSIGLGAALTPIGEPLSTIAISKLNEDFFFLLELIGPKILLALVVFGLLSALFVQPPRLDKKVNDKKTNSERYEEIFIRALKIFFFVMGLTLLGAGFEPLINRYLLGLDPLLLYWINMISSVLDNATLAAAEISPVMDHFTIQSILLGLLISGGMLIPGNIPNIIAAGKLKITSKEWAKFGVPIGFITMLVYFIIIVLFS
jgi:predicted cation transporter